MNMIKSGTTSKLDMVYITNLSTGAPITGATFSGVTIGYVVSTGSTVTHASAVTMTLGTWVTLGFKEVDSVNFPGLYQVGIPNAAFATAGTFAFVSITGVTGQAPCVIKYQVTAFDPNDTVRLGLTALPNIAQGSAGQLATGSATGQVTVATNNDKTGYALTVTPPTTANIAAAILTTPANLLATDASGRVTAASVAGAVGSVTSPVTIDLTQAVPNTAISPRQTVGSGLLGADAGAFGKEVLNVAGGTLTIYASDGTTVLRTFTLDSGTNPTQRT